MTNVNKITVFNPQATANKKSKQASKLKKVVGVAKPMISFAVNTEKMFRAADKANLLHGKSVCHMPSEGIDGHSGMFRVTQFAAGYFLYRGAKKSKLKAKQLSDTGGIKRADTDLSYSKTYMAAAVPRGFKDFLSFWNFVAPKTATLTYTPVTTAAAVKGLTLGSALAIGNLGAVTVFTGALLVKSGIELHRANLCSKFIEAVNTQKENSIEKYLDEFENSQAGLEKLKRRIGSQAVESLKDKGYLVEIDNGSIFSVEALYNGDEVTLCKEVKEILLEGAKKTAKTHNQKAITTGLFGIGVLIILTGMFLAFFSTPVPILGFVGSVLVWCAAAYGLKNLCQKHSLGTKIKRLITKDLPNAISSLSIAASKIFANNYSIITPYIPIIETAERSSEKRNNTQTVEVNRTHQANELSYDHLMDIDDESYQFFAKPGYLDQDTDDMDSFNEDAFWNHYTS